MNDTNPAVEFLLKRFLDGAAGDGLVCGGVDAADLYCALFGEPVLQTSIVGELYLIQDTRTYVGNCPMWWGPNSRGYTTDIIKAGRYTLDQATAQHLSRRTDKPWKWSDIEPLARNTIDVQDLRQIAPVVISQGAAGSQR
jgi:hypothetical protein